MTPSISTTRCLAHNLLRQGTEIYTIVLHAQYTHIMESRSFIVLYILHSLQCAYWKTLKRDVFSEFIYSLKSVYINNSGVQTK